MYRVIIVEDEELMQRGLTSLVPWEQWGFEVAGAFWDGAEAYEWLQTNYCEVVLTDIMMSEMNGLELAKALSEEKPNIKVVILSGYSDFEYAKKAIQYGVVDYLLKPNDQEEMRRVFTKLKLQLDMEKYKDQSRSELTAQCRILVQKIDAGETDSLKEVFGHYIERISMLPIESVQEILKNLCIEIAELYKKREIDVWEITNGKFNVVPLYEQHSFQEAQQYVLELLLTLMEGLADREDEEYLIGRVKGYIREHMSEDIGNIEIARRYNLTPSYVSRVFRQKTGETVSDYMMRVRMEKAIEIMKEGKYMTNEISQMVGYNSHSYFSKVFKAYTGYTPTEYWNVIRKD
ncbi:MAG: response regulator [Lachnospiraceae bacterium]|nr:response regulator [Lachnospiraceae bacterium]